MPLPSGSQEWPSQIETRQASLLLETKPPAHNWLLCTKSVRPPELALPSPSCIGAQVVPFQQATLSASTPPMLVNTPPTMSRPLYTAIALIEPLTPELPSVENVVPLYLASPTALTPPATENEPP